MTYCKAMASGAVSHILGKRRCQRSAIKDGFCAVHHPDKIKAKDEARRKLFADQDRALARRNAIDAATARVVRAAIRWVNVNDQGTLQDLKRLTNAQIELGRAVEALEKARKL